MIEVDVTIEQTMEDKKLQYMVSKECHHRGTCGSGTCETTSSCERMIFSICDDIMLTLLWLASFLQSAARWLEIGAIQSVVSHQTELGTDTTENSIGVRDVLVS